MTTKLARPRIDKINREHNLAVNCAADSIMHAIECGRLLIEARAALGAKVGRPGNSDTRVVFSAWVAEHCEFELRQAQRYMQAYRNRALLSEQVDSLRKLLQVTKPKLLPRDTPPLPEGKFDVVLADPPWEYEFSETDSRAIESHYESMNVEAIATLPITEHLADVAVLFLWATAPKLPEAMTVLEQWGLDYKTNAVWDKEKIGMGYWFRGRHELLLVATHGKATPPEAALRRPSVFSEPRGEHSRKPEVVYDAIEAMFPSGRRLELFARKERPHWTNWPPLT